MNIVLRVEDDAIFDLRNFDAVQVRGAEDEGDPTIKYGLVAIRFCGDPKQPTALMPEAAFLTSLPNEQSGLEVLQEIETSMMQDVRYVDARGVIARHEEEIPVA